MSASGSEPPPPERGDGVADNMVDPIDEVIRKLLRFVHNVVCVGLCV